MAWKEDERYLGLFVKTAGARRLDAVTPADVADVIDRFAVDGKRIAGNRALASIRACLGRAWNEGRIPDNPARRVRPDGRAEEEAVRTRVLTDKELERMAKAVDVIPDPYVRVAFYVLAETGLRVSELRRITRLMSPAPSRRSGRSGVTRQGVLAWPLGA